MSSSTALRPLLEQYRGASFLRWAGGKRQMLHALLRVVPSDVCTRAYIEPFAGAASLFFAIAPQHALLADANEALMRTYKWVRDDCENVIRALRELSRDVTEQRYYSVRAEYNRARDSATQAARFIYLNKTSFNGIFRVNRRGFFNVPYGKKKTPAIPCATELRDASRVLAVASLRAGVFDETLAMASRGDFLYIDPPYPPLNGTSYFTHYTRDCFSDDDQRRLADRIATLSRKGCLFLLTNADTETVRELYGNYIMEPISVTRYVTCKKVRHSVTELAIRNF